MAVALSLVVFVLSDSGSFLALFLLDSLGSLLLRSLRDLLVVVVLAGKLSLVDVLGLSGSLVLLGSGSSAVGGLGVCATEKESVSKTILNNT